MEAGVESRMKECYRHPGRETGVSCSNCGRPICTDCMTPTPVGMRCPECSRDRTPVKTIRSMTTDPVLTYGLIVVNVLAYFGSRSGGSVFSDGALQGLAVADGELWRLITSGFLHGGLLHLAFNMYLLYVLGQMLEPALGRVQFGALYLTSLLCGSFGALALTNPAVLTVGASGAVFGLMGAGFMIMRQRGIDPMASGLGPTILLNLGITFLIPNISIGGHVGGLIGGGLAGLAFAELSGRRRGPVLALLACLALTVVAVAGAIVVA